MFRLFSILNKPLTWNDVVNHSLHRVWLQQALYTGQTWNFETSVLSSFCTMSRRTLTRKMSSPSLTRVGSIPRASKSVPRPRIAEDVTTLGNDGVPRQLFSSDVSERIDEQTPGTSTVVSTRRKSVTLEQIRSDTPTLFEECLEPEDTEEDSPSVHSEKELLKLLAEVLQLKESQNVSSMTLEAKLSELCRIFYDLLPEQRYTFIKCVAQSYGVSHKDVLNCALSLLNGDESRGELSLIKLEEKLRVSLNPKYNWLFSQLGRLEGGVKFLSDLRTDVLDLLNNVGNDEMLSSQLRALNGTLKDLLSLWFSVGFLQLERVTWQTSCEMLQKVSEYEAVHPVRNWTDLKRRVGPYRRCFVFTHSTMPREPIVVLHTALTNHIPSSIRSIVVQPRMMSVDSNVLPMSSQQTEDSNFISTAVFYSITSTQRGLQGIELGNYLIKRVVRELKAEYPNMGQFSSLSPIPGFKSWLLDLLKSAEKANNTSTCDVFLQSELDHIKSILGSSGDSSEIWSILKHLIGTNQWVDSDLTDVLETPLLRLCARYLYVEKRRGYALDAVGNFHLRNGAMIWRLNWKADISPRGLNNSCGIMVNYRYFLDSCEEHSRKYLEDKQITISDQMSLLVKLGKDLSHLAESGQNNQNTPPKCESKL